MPILSVDPFKRLGIPGSSDMETVKKAFDRAMEDASPAEKKLLEQECSFLLQPGGLFFARLSTPLGGRTFTELKESLPLRPRYVGPGKWKKVLRQMLQEEEYPRK